MIRSRIIRLAATAAEYLTQVFQGSYRRQCRITTKETKPGESAKACRRVRRSFQFKRKLKPSGWSKDQTKLWCVAANQEAHMDRDQLRALRAPLKQRYREDPESALITLGADGFLRERVACSVSTGAALVEAGLHPATGGTGLEACSGDMLLQALVACA